MSHRDSCPAGPLGPLFGECNCAPCMFCDQPIERVDGPGQKFPFRHSESKRIVCFDVYKPEIATPATGAE